jgi:RNA polymerase sigma factor (sigma-70 family)
MLDTKGYFKPLQETRPETTSLESGTLELSAEYLDVDNNQKQLFWRYYYENLQEDIDYTSLSLLNKNTLTYIDANASQEKKYYKGAIKWHMDSVDDLLNSRDDINIESLKAFINPKRNISFSEAESLVFNKPKTLITAMTLLEKNYQREIDLSPKETGRAISSSFAFTEEEEMIFFTGRALLIAFNDVQEDPYIEDLINGIDNIIVTFNSRLAWSIAKDHQGHLEKDDAFQYANTGTLRALEDFDITQGNKFATYATWWMRQRVVRAERQHGRNIALPVFTHDRINKFYRYRNNLEKDLGKGVPLQEALDSYIQYRGLSNSKVKTLVAALKVYNTLSLDREFNDSEDGDTLLKVLASDKTDLQQAINQSDDEATLKKLFKLAELTFRERTVLSLRYGLAGENQHTLDEVGKRLGVNTEAGNEKNSTNTKR